MTAKMQEISREVEVRIKLRAGNWQAFHSKAPEMLVEGPARTGKTFVLLLRMVRHAQDIAGYRGLITRKVAATLSSTILRTLEEDVLHEWDSATHTSALDHVHYFGGSQHEPAAYVFDNGSRIVVGGMDAPTKILGAEYDEIYYNEIIEGTVEDVETLLSRLSHGLLPNPAFFGDCNPSWDKHWVLLRALSGSMQRIKTYLKDNPAFYDDEGEPTERGLAYLQSISGLTGSRYQRLVAGLWLGMENAVYPQLDPSIHLAALPNPVVWIDGAIGVDFGKTPEHPSTVVAITKASDGVVWVREAWAEIGGNVKAIEDAARGMKVRYGIQRGETDPIQEVLAQRLGFKAAKMGKGTRKQRIGNVTTLLDAKALMFDIDGLGVRETFDEGLNYRWEVRETETNIEAEPVRKDEDRIASMEYAADALVNGRVPYMEPRTTGVSYSRKPVVAGRTLRNLGGQA